MDLNALIDNYTENLMRGAFSLGFNESEAEELVQDTFYAFLEGGSRFEGRSRLLTYLFGILYNKARTSRRYQNRHESIDASVDASFDSHFDGEDHWKEDPAEPLTEVEKTFEATTLGVLLRHCLEGLNVTWRMAFTLKEVEGLDTKAICATLGLKPNHLGVTLFRARNKLRDCLMAKGAVL